MEDNRENSEYALKIEKKKTYGKEIWLVRFQKINQY